ncbi:hypothetical protein [Nocardiopsis sp. MG754419]|uniref:hypothetical protein n=1 Tax=Nocardiopsis sp. MG754419 TaxID=2259865 RepID=UPI001BAB87CE|nr:hypothetical protein [Nocardiopsis sp. MG754419]MBR8742442.1 hypothetical protein [Nocardiopsis sp. MG754419]
MSSPNDPNELEFEDRLRQVLRAEADEFTPSGEGLQLIRERTERRRGALWFGLPWLRPVVAVAGAVLIAASVIMSSPQVRDQVLEMVPAGADREGTPPAEGKDEGGGVAAPSTATDSATGSSQPSDVPEDDPRSTPSPEDEEGSEDEGPQSTSTCPPREEVTPTATGSERDKDDKDTRASDDPDCDPEREPTDEPTTGPGTDPGTDPGEDPEDDPTSGGGGPGSGNGNTGGEDDGNGGTGAE